MVLSNFVNSGLRQIKVLTQYKSASLEEHIARAWHLSPMLDNFIETIPAQQRTGKDWFKGSADAVFQTMHVDHRRGARPRVHLRRRPRLQDGRAPDARRSTSPTTPTSRSPPSPSSKHEAKDFGVIEAEADGRIKAFHEKVAEPPHDGRPAGMCLASMGNYIFKTERADRARSSATPTVETSPHDFGKDIIPTMVKARASASSSTTSAKTASPARRRATPTGATSAPSTPTGPRRWTSSPSSRRSTSTTTAGRIRTGLQPRPAGQVRLPRRGQRARRHRDREPGLARLHHLRRPHPPERALATACA